MSLRCQRQAAACSQVKLARIARQFDHHPAQRRAAKPIRRRAQHRSRIGQHAQDQPRRVHPDRRQPGRMQRPRLSPRRLLDQPQDLSADHPDKQRRKARRTARLAKIGKQLVHPPPLYPTAESSVDRRMTC